MENIKFVKFNGDVMTGCPECGSISVKERFTSTEINGEEFWIFIPIKCNHGSFKYKKEPIAKALEDASVVYLPEVEVK